MSALKEELRDKCTAQVAELVEPCTRRLAAAEAKLVGLQEREVQLDGESRGDYLG